MSLKESLQIHRKYFTEYSKEIALRNLKLMQTVCYCGITVFLAYYCITYFFFRSQMISFVYGIFVPILLLFLIRIKRILKNDAATFRNTQILTILMYLIVMIYCIIMSVFAHPELNAVYYPLFLVTGPVMFILPLYQQFFINASSCIVFFYCVIHVKPEALWMHDLFESFTALVFSAGVILLMTQFRVQSDNLKSKYYSLSRQDGLTGILNKTAGSEMAKSYIEDDIRREPFALVLFDVDDFKGINDTYGHEAGDVVLKTFGQLLSEAFRKGDIVSRYGGDEFLILMKNISREDCERKLTALEEHVMNCKIRDEISISVSIGIYTGICGKDEFGEALEKADQALYLVKQQGKQSHCYYHEL